MERAPAHHVGGLPVCMHVRQIQVEDIHCIPDNAKVFRFANKSRVRRFLDRVRGNLRLDGGKLILLRADLAASLVQLRRDGLGTRGAGPRGAQVFRGLLREGEDAGCAARCR